MVPSTRGRAAEARSSRPLWRSPKAAESRAGTSSRYLMSWTAAGVKLVVPEVPGPTVTFAGATSFVK